MILGKQIVLEDMAEVDIETYNSLQWVMDNDPEDLFLTFCAQESRFGEVIFGIDYFIYMQLCYCIVHADCRCSFWIIAKMNTVYM